MIELVLSALLMAGFSQVATADDGVSVEGAWMRPTATGTGAVYLTLHNATGLPVELTGVDCAPASCMMHQSSEHDGTMSMRMLDSLLVPAKGEAAFKPGAMHIMVMGLKAPLAEGGTFPIVLRFKTLADLPVTVPIRKGAPR
jgi:copper(I)-binding protein